MFRSAAVKLTTWYLAIIMLLSLGTSIALYHVSSNDLENNAHRQTGYIRGLFGPGSANDFASLREHQLNEDLHHLKVKLTFFNILVFVGGGGAAYALARRTLRPIESALEAQTRFTTDASHELRTPLTAIQSENEVALRNSKLTKNEALDIINSNLEEIAKLKNLSDGLLALARDKDKGPPDSLKLDEIIKEAIDRQARAASLKNIKIEKTNQQNLIVKGNKVKLIDLLSILLDNAIKYSSGNSSVRIKAYRSGKNTCIGVSDKGVGIRRSDLPHIFERFYRSDHSRNKEKIAGYGLGLAIAKKTADEHNGVIEVESALNKGSTFTLKLPD